MFPGLQIDREIGRGARGIVYKAYRDGQTVALKVPTRNDPAEHLWFRREGAILGCLRHPSLAQVIEVDETPETPYLVREYLDGETLATELEAGPLSEARIIALALSMAEALSEIHKRGLVHRDIKPHNIILLRDSTVKLIDFGLATHAQPTQANDQAVGTFLYSAPEQTGLLKRPVDGRADLYALGAMLFECASGGPPFHSENLGDLLRQHAVVVPRELTEVSPALRRIIARLLAKEPDERYQTGQGLAADLRQLEALNLAHGRGETVLLGRHDGPAQVLFEPTLIGREEPLERLRATWAQAQCGAGGAVLLEGPSGGGKSRLIAEFVQLHPKMTCHRGRCMPEDATPFRALREAFQATDLQALLEPGVAEGLFLQAEDFPEAVADFVLGLGDDSDGVALLLDDVQWMDEATLQLLRRLSRRLPQSSLLVLCAGRSGECHRVTEALASALLWSHELTLLGEAEVGRLTTAHLGGRPVDRALVRQLHLFSQGSPLAIGEYVRVLLEEGLLRLTSQGWVARSQATESLALPQDVLAQRLSALTFESAVVMRYAAVMGPRFSLDVLRAVCGDVEQAVAEASQLNLVERVAGSDYVFVHEQLRRAILEGPSLAPLHQRVAEVLEALHGDVYAIAQHYSAGVPGQSPAKVYESNLKAGQRALHNFAHEEAYRFLTAAAETQAPEGDFHAVMGEACYRTGRLPEAREHFQSALETTRDRVARARLWSRLAAVALDRHDRSQARRETDRALAELGGRPASGVVATLFTVARYLFAEMTGLGYGRVPEADAELVRTVVGLQTQSTVVAYGQMRYLDGMAMGFTALRMAHGLGPSRELVSCWSHLGAAVGMLGWRRVSERYLRKCEDLGRQLGDPVALAISHLHAAFAQSFLGSAPRAEALLTQHLERDGRWLETRDFLDGCADMAFNLMMRGYAREAMAWIERARERGGAQARRSLASLESAEIWLRALLGRPSEALERINAGGTDVHFYGGVVGFHLEQEELGAALEETVAAFRALKLSPLKVALHRRHFYVLHAYARAELCRRKPTDRAARQAFSYALQELRTGWRVPLLTAHLHFLEAVQARLSGRRWETLLARAEEAAARADSPWVHYEILRERAHVAEAAGHGAAALRYARQAHALALQHGWANRARRLRREFPRGWSAHGVPDSAPSQAQSTLVSVGLRRHLDALLELSLASTSVLDRGRLARVMLDHAVKVLAAERGFLFLGGELLAARDAEGRTLPEGEVYSRTVVDEVIATQHVVLLSGTEDGQAIGAHSVIAHQLRSIVAAPLMVRQSLRGVVYLDNRLARGLFQTGDAEILQAMCGHIAAALETSRAAELELQFETEQQQRRLAEILRDLNASLASTLEESEVANYLLQAVQAVVPCDTAALGAPSEAGLWENEEGYGLGVALDGAGAIVLRREGRPFTAHELELARTFASQGAMAFEKTRLFAEVVRLARHDGLTGVFNRRYFLELGERELTRCQRQEGSLCVVLLDVDHFKRFNDTYGHSAGDDVLKLVAGAVQGSLRSFDVLGRYGGEEFVVLLPQTDLAAGLGIAERLRVAISECKSEEPRVTASLGLAPFTGSESLEELLNAADAALYRAKAAGRNQVCR